MKQQCQEIKSAYDCSTCYITWITYNPFWYPGYAFKIIMNAVCIVTVFSAHMLTSTTDTFGWFRFLVAISLETLGSDPEREYRNPASGGNFALYIYVVWFIDGTVCITLVGCHVTSEDSIQNAPYFIAYSCLLSFLLSKECDFPTINDWQELL